jgi:hypothetical protein
MRLVFTADEIAAMSALRRAALDVILASLERDERLAFIQEHAAAIRDELAWIGTVPPRLLMQAFSSKRLRARERRRRVLRVVSPIASTPTTIRCAAVAPDDDLFEDVTEEGYAAVLTWARRRRSATSSRGRHQRPRGGSLRDPRQRSGASGVSG